MAFIRIPPSSRVAETFPIKSTATFLLDAINLLIQVFILKE